MNFLSWAYPNRIHSDGPCNDSNYLWKAHLVSHPLFLSLDCLFMKLSSSFFTNAKVNSIFSNFLILTKLGLIQVFICFNRTKIAITICLVVTCLRLIRYCLKLEINLNKWFEVWVTFTYGWFVVLYKTNNSYVKLV